MGRAFRPRAGRTQLAIPGLIVLTVEIDAAATEQSVDDPQRLFKPAHAMAEREAEFSKLWFVITGAKAKDQPAVADFLNRGSLFGQKRRVAEACAGDERSEFDA